MTVAGIIVTFSVHCVAAKLDSDAFAFAQIISIYLDAVVIVTCVYVACEAYGLAFVVAVAYGGLKLCPAADQKIRVHRLVIELAVIFPDFHGVFIFGAAVCKDKARALFDLFSRTAFGYAFIKVFCQRLIDIVGHDIEHGACTGPADLQLACDLNHLAVLEHDIVSDSCSVLCNCRCALSLQYAFSMPNAAAFIGAVGCQVSSVEFKSGVLIYVDSSTFFGRCVFANAAIFYGRRSRSDVDGTAVFTGFIVAYDNVLVGADMPDLCGPEGTYGTAYYCFIIADGSVLDTDQRVLAGCLRFHITVDTAATAAFTVDLLSFVARNVAALKGKRAVRIHVNAAAIFCPSAGDLAAAGAVLDGKLR